MSRIIINKKNYLHNLDIISKQAGSKEKVAVVLKDNAYGHGIIEISKIAKEFGIKKAVVKNLKEALKIEEFFEDIIILSENVFHTYSHSFHIVINHLEQIYKLPKNTNVHLKVDTGMHRNGISKNQLKEAIYGICSQNLNLTGIMTHHRGADELNSEFFWQKRNFRLVKEEVKRICEQLFLPLPLFHSCNSAALFRTTDLDDDFARVGIACYGYIGNPPAFDKIDLKPVLSLWAQKIATRTLKKNQSVGYGGTYKTDKDIIVSTYDIGYGDGFLRINENQAYKTPKGFRVLGRISMDNLSLDSQDEEVCMFDDAKALAKIHNTITYEIVTTLSTELKREVI
ncbi:alanine racemase [Arcobacter sp.]|uniref:alanine racemase n=1 Tax=unclassified Arcobacter TaxID=2593671 RepID=UPI003AFFB9ED